MSEGAFEAKVSGKRESSNGIFLTLQIQPDDYTSALATLRVGASLQLGWAEVVNTAVEPISAGDIIPTTKQEIAASAKAARKFYEMPYSQQAALRCNDKQFQECFFAADAIGAADKVRFVCNVKSRSELDHPDCAGRVMWEKMEADYQAYLTDKRYGGPRFTGRELG